MRAFFRVIITVFLLIGLLDYVRPTYASVCCGIFTCTKYEGQTAVDDYSTSCGCQNDGCPAGYIKSGDCTMETSCGGGGTTTCPCGLNTAGTACKSCTGTSCPTPVNCPADRKTFRDTPTLYGDNWSVNCPIGTAQSASCTDHREIDGVST